MICHVFTTTIRRLFPLFKKQLRSLNVDGTSDSEVVTDKEEGIV